MNNVILLITIGNPWVRAPDAMCIRLFCYLEIYYFWENSIKKGPSSSPDTLWVSVTELCEPLNWPLSRGASPAVTPVWPWEVLASCHGCSRGTWIYISLLPLHFPQRTQSLPSAPVAPTKDPTAEAELIQPKLGPLLPASDHQVPVPIPPHSLCTTAWSHPLAHTKVKLSPLSPCISLQTRGFA